MKNLKYLISILFVGILLFSNSANASVLISYPPPPPENYVIRGGTGSMNNTPQYTELRLDLNAKISKFTWWGIEDINSQQNFNWYLAFYKKTGSLPGDLIYEKNFSYDLAQAEYLRNFMTISWTDTNGNEVLIGSKEMLYSYDILESLTLNKDTDYLVSIKAIFDNNEVWCWFSQVAYIDETTNTVHRSGYAFELEGNPVSSPAPEPSSIIFGLIGLAGIVRSRFISQYRS